MSRETAQSSQKKRPNAAAACLREYPSEFGIRTQSCFFAIPKQVLLSQATGSSISQSWLVTDFPPFGCPLKIISVIHHRECSPAVAYCCEPLATVKDASEQASDCFAETTHTIRRTKRRHRVGIIRVLSSDRGPGRVENLAVAGEADPLSPKGMLTLGGSDAKLLCTV